MAPEDPATSTAADVPKGVAPVADAMAEVEAKEEVPQRALVEEKKGKEIAGKTPQPQKGFSFLMPALFRNAETNEQKVAMLQNMLEDVGEPNQQIPFPNVSHKILQRVLEYCIHHKDDLPSLGDDDKDSSPSSRKRTDDIDEWDEHFMPMEDEIKELFALILAAHYLDIKPLLDLGCKTVANMIRGKSPEQIREMFNIENDFQAEDCSIIKSFLMGLLDGRDAVIGLDFCDEPDLNIPGVETSKLDIVKNIYNWADSVLLTSNTASSSKSHTEIQTLDFLKSYLPTGIVSNANLGFGDDSDLGSATIAAAAESASETGLTASILPTGVSDIFEPDALSDVFGSPFDKGACLAAFCCPREELTAADTTGDTTDTDNEVPQANSEPIANRVERPRKRGREEVVRENGPVEKTPKGMKGWMYLLEAEENSRGALCDANNPIAFDIDTPMTTRRSSRVAHQRHKLLPSQIRKMPAPSVSSVVDTAAPSAEEVFTPERAYLARFQKQSHQFYLKSTFFDEFPIAVTDLRLCQMVVQELQTQLDDAVRAKKGLEKRVEELTHELEDGVESKSALVEAKKRLERELEVREWLEETEDSSAALQKKASSAADCELSPDAERLLEDEDEIKELDAGKRAAVAAASVADHELSQNAKRLLADKIEEQKASFDGLCKQIKEILGEKVEKVVISNRTIVVIGPENQLADPTLRDSSMSSYMVSKKTLELNPNDPSVQYLKTKVDADKNDKTVRDLTYVLLAAATINSEHCNFAGTDKGAQVEEVPLLEYQKDVLNLAVRLADTDGTEGELWKLLSEMNAENEKGRLLLSALDLFKEKLNEFLDCPDGDMLDGGGQVFSADAEDGFM
ncbi:hypothetical protein HK097_011508 [Rhizophlyctis rosea]|uniref:Uncharacterized protein n=1 Tax=Rhizophlyctis rosea TaxID=64517 RepID=A0AAD5X2E8_9FUNG|nr:hypothetical protein HK097_011508 [Rhizophlyctis rosea]